MNNDENQIKNIQEILVNNLKSSDNNQDYLLYKNQMLDNDRSWDICYSVEDFLCQFKNGRNPMFVQLKDGENENDYYDAKAQFNSMKISQQFFDMDLPKIIQEEYNCQLENLKESSLLLNGRYENVNFDNTETGINPSFDNAFLRCKAYAEHAEDIIQLGQGIYIVGDTGTGKTHLAACISNYFISKLHSVVFTNIDEIIKQITTTFKKNSESNEQEIVNTYCNADLLVLDDFGTEKIDDADSFVQKKMYDLINKRYIIKKPTIFTSNLSLKELHNKGLMKKIIERVYEMSTVVLEIRGESYRIAKRKREKMNLLF